MSPTARRLRTGCGAKCKTFARGWRLHRNFATGGSNEPRELAAFGWTGAPDAPVLDFGQAGFGPTASATQYVSAEAILLHT